MLRSTFIVCVLMLMLGLTVNAEDRYYQITPGQIGITNESMVKTDEANDALKTRSEWRWWPFLQPRVAMNGGVEAYVLTDDNWRWSPEPQERLSSIDFVIRVPEGTSKIDGRLFMKAQNRIVEEYADFSVAVDSLSEYAIDANAFNQAKRRHFSRLRGRNVPGAAWFRYQEREASDSDVSQRRRGPDMMYNDTFSLFTGGRALSENLQLDRELTIMGDKTSRTIDISSIEGITTEEINWEALTKDIDPALDPLADYLPYDQHAIFFSSFNDMLRLRDEAAERGAPILHLMEVRAEDARSQQKYETQLALHTDALSRMLGPTLISSVAFTGSDPYLRTGSDVAVLFQTVDGPGLRALIEARQQESGLQVAGAKIVKGQVDGVAYTGVVSPDRAVSSYMIALDDVVIVANSTAQLSKLIAVKNGAKQALSSLPEYHFFRDRYRRGEADETGLLVLTDATIRRWCSPQWRIAASRRARAAAVLAELEVRRLDGKPIDSFPVPYDFGKVTVENANIVSETYGRLDFQTPISEMDITRVSQRERDAYNRFRRSYQRAWSNFFDPIAIRFGVDEEELSMDLTVRPLIASSDYREMMEVTSGEKLEPLHGDPHPEAAFQVVASINRDAQPVREVTNMARGMAPNLPGDPLNWLGGWATLFADKDPFWDELQAAKDKGENELEDFFEQNFNRLPVAIEFDVDSPFALAGFVTAIRAFIEQSAPDLTQWEARKHNEMSYVRVSTDETMSPDGPEIAVFYAARPEGFLLTLSEDLLQRTLDRWAARKKKAEKPQQPVDPTVAAVEEPVEPWMGENLAMRAGGGSLEMAHSFFDEEIREAMIRRSWGNLPILNVWHGLYPELDAVAVHEQHFGIRLICPGGGQYVWNEEYRTMESTALGHPGQPRLPEGEIASPLQGIESVALGLTFEEDGLRAKGRVSRK